MANHSRLPLLSLALAGMLTACGGDSRAAAIGDWIDVQNDFAAVLEGIHSKGDLRAARDEIESLAKRTADIDARLAKLGDPGYPQSTREAVPALGRRAVEAQERLAAAMQRMLQDPELRDEFSRVMSEVDFGR